MTIFEQDALGRSIIEIIFKNSGSIFAKDGVAYFLSHIFNTKGTLKQKEKFYSLLEEDAIELHANVNKEFFSLSVRFLNEKEKKAEKLLAELLCSLNLTEESVEKSKKEIIAKIQNKKNDNDYIAATNLYKAIFKNTPPSRPVMGENPENIILNDIEKFYNSLFKKEYIVINGGKKQNLEEITKLFSPEKEKTPFFTPKKNEDIYHYKNVEQSYIHFAAPFDVDYKKELHLAKIATFVLGAGGFGSRMMEEIRVKRGYAYSAYAGNDFRKTYKLLSGYLQTKLENSGDALNLVKEMIKEFQANGISQEELNQAKRFLIGSEPLRNETLTQRLLKKFNEIYLELPENYYKKELELIKNTSLDEVNEFIKKHPEITDITFSMVTKE
ncbi:M16 family metallopeptidase [Nautilia sp.]